MPSAGRAKTHDDVLEDIAKAVPGFGGLFQDSTGQVVAYLLDPATQSSDAEPVIRDGLQAARQWGISDLNRLANASISFKKGRYTFLSLMAWKRTLYATAIPAGTVLAGIDKRTNQVYAAVVNEPTRTAWRSLARLAGLPDDALRVELMDPVGPSIGLRDAVRPTAGGVQIMEYNNGLPVGICSMTGNVVVAWDPNNRYFVTASHCSKKMWDLDPGSNEWHQPAFPNLIAVGEAKDPLPFSGTGCPSGKLCRYSDATLVQYSETSAWQLGRLAITPNLNPLSITSFQQYTAPPWFFWGQASRFKTGRTTGTTAQSYPNQLTCLDFYPDSAVYAQAGVTIGSNWALLCQTKAILMVAAGGDSGAPMYWYEGLPYTTPHFDGVYHAGGLPNQSADRIYSTEYGINADLGVGYYWLSWY